MSGLSRVERSRIARASPVSAAALLAIPVLASAQTVEGPVAVLEEVVVTAEKRTSTVQESPLAVTALSGSALERTRVDTLQDMQQSVPNLVVTQNTALGQPYIRGVGNEILAGLNDSAVATHLDGVYIPRGTGLVFDFYDVDRVEVLRGPQGTLYGRNATGGAINVITRQPAFEPEGSIGLTVGNYNDRRITAAASAGIVPDTLAIRGAVLAERRDGYQTNLFGGGELSDKDLFAGRLSLKYVTGAWDITLAGDHSDDSSTGGATRELSGDPALAPARLVGGTPGIGFFDVNVDTPTRQSIENSGARLTIRRDDARFGFTSISGYRRTRFEMVLDQDGMQVPAIAGNPQIQNSDSYSQEFQLAGALDRLQYIVGLYYFHERAQDYDHFDFGLPFTSAGLQDLLYDATGTTQAYAAYGQATYNFTDALSATLGLRAGHEEKVATTRNAFNFAQLPVVQRELESSPTSPKLGLQYRIAPDVNAYVSATKGFKSGGINTISLTNEAYGPESLWAYELGLKADWLGRRLRTNVAAFYYDYKNMQVNTYTGVGTLVDNAGFATIQGVELELQAAPTANLHVDAQISWLDAEFDQYVTINPDDPAAGLQDLEGNRLPRAPKLSYSVAAQYDFDLFADHVLSIRGEYQWRDRVFYSQYETALVGQESFGLANASVLFRPREGRYSVALWGRNLEDTQWHAFAGSSPGVTGVQAIPAAPRTYGLTVSYDF